MSLTSGLIWCGTMAAAVAPTLISLNFTVADTLGGDSIIATLDSVAGTPTVTVGGTSATVTASDSTTVTFTMPAKSAGNHDVVVTTDDGASNAISIEAFNPGVLAKCIFFLRADVGVTTSDTDRVDSWATQVDAGDGNKTVSSSGSNRPKLTAAHASYNNKPAIATDGDNQRLLPAGVWGSGTISQAFEVTALGHCAVDSGALYRWLSSYNGSPHFHIIRDDTVTDLVRGWSTYSGVWGRTTVLTTSPTLISYLANGSSTAVYIGDHDTPATITPSGSLASNTSGLSSIGVGAFANGGTPIGNVPSGSAWAFVAAFDDALTDAERARVFQWASCKWGIAWS